MKQLLLLFMLISVACFGRNGKNINEGAPLQPVNEYVSPVGTVTVCGLPATLLAHLHDWIIIEDSACSAVRKIMVADFLASVGVNFDTTGLSAAFLKSDGSVIGGTSLTQTFQSGVASPNYYDNGNGMNIVDNSGVGMVIADSAGDLDIYAYSSLGLKALNGDVHVTGTFRVRPLYGGGPVKADNTGALVLGGGNFNPDSSYYTKRQTDSIGGGGSGWSLTGNAALNSGVNFIGTTDTVPLHIGGVGIAGGFHFFPLGSVGSADIITNPVSFPYTGFITDNSHAILPINYWYMGEVVGNTEPYTGSYFTQFKGQVGHLHNDTSVLITTMGGSINIGKFIGYPCNEVSSFAKFITLSGNKYVNLSSDTTIFMNINGKGIVTVDSSGVGIGTSTKDASAIVDISSTTQGFLPPRMTGAQAEAIVSPADGLMIFCNSGDGVTITSTGWWGYNAGWTKIH